MARMRTGRTIRDRYTGEKRTGYFEYCFGSNAAPCREINPDHAAKYSWVHRLGICSHCMKIITVKKDGTLREHGRYV